MLKIAVIHKYIAEKNLPFFMQGGLAAKELCEKYNYDVFITGDNHSGFFYQHSKTEQIVINPGSMTRQEVTQKNYKPRIYLFDTETKIVETIFLLDNDLDVIIDIRNNNEEIRMNRIDSFIESLKNKKKISLDFEKNLNLYCKENNVKSSVEEKIMWSLK